MEPLNEKQPEQSHGTAQACALVDVLANRFLSSTYLQTYAREEAVDRMKTTSEIPPIILQDTPWGLILTDGFRRLAAAKVAGLRALPAIINPRDEM